MDGELLWSVVRCCSCSPIQSVIYADLDTRVWGRLVPRVCCVTLSLPPPLIQWDTPRRPLWLFAVYCRVYTVCDVFSTTSVPCGLRRRQRTRRPHKLVSELVGGFSSVETDRSTAGYKAVWRVENERTREENSVTWRTIFTGIQDWLAEDSF